MPEQWNRVYLSFFFLILRSYHEGHCIKEAVYTVIDML